MLGGAGATTVFGTLTASVTKAGIADTSVFLVFQGQRASAAFGHIQVV